jgi:hypothetical protein
MPTVADKQTNPTTMNRRSVFDTAFFPFPNEAMKKPSHHTRSTRLVHAAAAIRVCFVRVLADMLGKGGERAAELTVLPADREPSGAPASSG